MTRVTEQQISEVDALRAALRECLEFMAVEQGWEWFRAEFLYFDDEPKKRHSQENARQLRNFLAKPEILKYVKELAP